MASSSSEAARREFEAVNSIQTVPSVDSIYKFSYEEQQEILSKKPWEKE